MEPSVCCREPRALNDAKQSYAEAGRAIESEWERMATFSSRASTGSVCAPRRPGGLKKVRWRTRPLSSGRRCHLRTSRRNLPSSGSPTVAQCITRLFVVRFDRFSVVGGAWRERVHERLRRARNADDGLEAPAHVAGASTMTR
jgi:hypothetical protein